MDIDRVQTARRVGDDASTYAHHKLTQTVIAAAFEVHNTLGACFLERVYENALAMELAQRGIPARQQAQIEVRYKGQPVGVYYADILVDEAVICEVKAQDRLTGVHEAQLLNYLKATGTKVGLLLNFGPKRVQIKRLVF